MHEKAKCVCFIYMQPQKMEFKFVQINMKQASYMQKQGPNTDPPQAIG